MENIIEQLPAIIDLPVQPNKHTIDAGKYAIEFFADPQGDWPNLTAQVKCLAIIDTDTGEVFHNDLPELSKRIEFIC